MRRRSFPGFLLAGLYVVYVIVRAMINPALAPKLPPGADRRSVRRRCSGRSLTSFLPLALLIVSRARRDPVRACDAVGGGRASARSAASCWRPPIARSTSSDAAGIGLPDRARHGDGLLSVHRLVDVLRGVRRARRPDGGRAVLRCRSNLSPTGFLLLTQVIIFLLGWPLEWTEIIIIFVPIFLPLLRRFRHRPDLLRHPGGAEHADRVQHAAGGDGGLLPEGRRAAAGEAHRHLQRRAAVRRSWCS